jgi:methylase of polypeptide subunit release factors
MIQASNTIVDFGWGSRHLSIPLALLLPNCEVIVVDLKAASLRLVHEKALQFSESKHESYCYPEEFRRDCA